MLIRKHIHKLLSQYYQQPSSAVVGAINYDKNITESSVDFKSLIFGKYHWEYEYSKLYKSQKGQWLTPVELFRPYYSQIMAKFLVSEIDAFERTNMQVFELGGGRGTNALIMLNYLKRNYPQYYDCIDSLTILDSSDSLLELQQEVFQKEGKDHIQCNKIQFGKCDMMDVAEKRTNFLSKSTTPTMIMAFELLDNLPHDKVWQSPESSAGTILQGQLQQSNNPNNHDTGHNGHESPTTITGTPLHEEWHPMNDPLLQQTIQFLPSFMIPTASLPIWIPTVACGIIHHIFEQRPQSSMLLADFDYLPPPTLKSSSSSSNNNNKSTQRISIKSQGEPLVTDMNDVDYECYLNSPLFCDILFPTNFDALAQYTENVIHHNCHNNNDCGLVSSIDVRKQHDFLIQYGSDILDDTKSRWSGYTPLLNDFTNCSVLTVSHSRGSVGYSDNNNQKNE